MSLEIKSMNVYVPAKDFELSKRFYTALGFTLTEGWAGSFDCRLGNALFRLQNYYVKDWANNFMMQFDVDDANEWYEHVKPIIDSGEFGDARIMLPEAVTDDTIITHVVDPTGVLLIFIQ
jgi:catechol 2,3-dioxygenase-like lactoylglutathione lyase family enzyme